MDNSPNDIFGKDVNKKTENISNLPPPDSNKGIMHNHTIYSIYDGVQTPLELVQAAKAAGYTNICLSDHGTLMGLAPFLKACKDEGVNGIPGVEIYVTDEKYPEIKRGHMCLYAKDNAGLKSITKIMAESFKDFEESGFTTKKVFPITTLDILEKYVDKGHVIATSACVNGVLSQTLCGNQSFLKKVNKLKEELAEFDIDKINKVIEEADKKEKEREDLREKVKSIVNISTSDLTQKAKTASKEEKALIKEQIAGIKEKNKKNAEYKKELKEQIKVLTEELKSLKQERTVAVKEKEKYDRILEKINDMPVLPEEERKPRTEKLIRKLKAIFGVNFYIELQYHGLDSEKEYYPKILEIAKSMGIKTVIANDAHFDIKGKDYQRWLVSASGMITYYNFVSYPDKTDAEYYIKTEAELTNILTKIVAKEDVEEAINNTYSVLSNCKVELDNSLHFPQFSDTAENDLRELTYKGATERYGELTNEIKARIEYELNTINTMGFADYILIVWDYCKHAGDLMEEKFGTRVVSDGRGSGAGSVVLYCLKITGVDPLQYGLLFERFLNPSRVSMPKQIGHSM